MEPEIKREVGKLISSPIVDEVKRAYLEYAMSVIVSRALPDVRDGLKPVHRRILFAMHSEGLHYNKRYSKCAGIVGEVLKKYHPHGDSAVYDALVRMAQDFSMRYQLVDGQGNFGCFTADTKVKLADGRDLSFAELIEEDAQGKNNYTFTVNKEGTIEVAKIEKPRLTKKKAEIVEISLDNGEKIRCTPNHKFMLKNGLYQEAKDLAPGTSLMPGYFRISDKKDDLHIKGYSMIFQPAKEKWDFVHRLADNWNIEHATYTTASGKIRHHVNFNKLNNSPENIKRLAWADHWKIHYDFISEKHKTNPEYRQKLADGRRAFWSDQKNHQKYAKNMRQKNLVNWQDKTYREKMRGSLKRSSTAYLQSHPEIIEQIKERGSKTFKRLWQIPEYKQLFHDKIVTANKKRLTNQTGKKKFFRICAMLSAAQKNITKENYEQLRTETLGRKSYTSWDLGMQKYFAGDINKVLFELNQNHRVTSVKILNEHTNVFDLTIDKTHNFLLSAGVFVHNSMDGDSAAAYRYTEARLAKIAEELLADIDKNTVNFAANFDGEHTEPTVLPTRLPSLLLNGTVGIAVGMATSIAPHNLSELCDAIAELIDKPKTTIEDLCQIVKGPDFPTGGIIYNKKDIAAAYATGRGGIVIRAKAEIHENKSGQFQIIVTEIPYQVNKAEMIEKIADLVQEKKIEGIKDLRDESNKDGVRIVVDLKKDSYPKKILNQLFNLTALQTTFHFNMLALVDGIQPRVLNLKNVLEEFVKHRKVVIRRRTEFDLEKALDRAHILEGLKMALDKIDLIIKLIRASADKEEAKVNLIAKFKFTDRQATAILEMKLQQLANLEAQRIEDELKEKKTIIKELESILASETKILNIIKTETKEMKEKYGDERRTQIIAHGVKEFTTEDLIPNEPTVVMVTTDGYIKRMPPDTFRQQSRGGKGVIGVTTKEEESVEHLITTNTHDNMLFFTNRGRCFQLMAYDMPVGSRTAKGQALVNFLQLAPNEKVTALLPMSDLTKMKFLVMVTTKGNIKKCTLEDFANVRRSGLIALKLKLDDNLEWVKPSSGNDEIMIATKGGQAIRFKEKDVRQMGRTAGGVRGMRLRSDDCVIGMDIVDPKNTALQFLTIGENGVGKRTDLAEYKVQGRGGSGIKTADVTAKTGNLIYAKVIDPSEADEHDLMMMSNKGQVIRLPFKSINSSGRATQGVRLMRFKEAGDIVAGVTIL